MKSFVQDLPMGRAVFGQPAADVLRDEVEWLALKRVLLISTPDQADQARAVAEGLGSMCVAHFKGARMHTPVEVTDEALAVLKDCDADGLLAIGGGSTIGLSKALAYRTGLPQIVVPTTYAGSEVTPVLGQTKDGVKSTLRATVILPKTVIYDERLTVTLPVALSVTSGINAVAHAVESLYAADATPLTRIYAKEGIAALLASLPLIVENPACQDARRSAQYGAWLCGLTLAGTSMGLHHKLCHVIGGMLNTPHAETHTIILPHAFAYNTPAIPWAVTELGKLLGSNEPAAALFARLQALAAPTALSAFGVTLEDAERVAEAVISAPYPNPVPLEREALTRLMQRAIAGSEPIVESRQHG